MISISPPPKPRDGWFSESGMVAVIVIWCLVALVNLALIGGAVWVIWHFVRKFW